VLLIIISQRSSAFLRVIGPVDFVTQLPAVLHAGSLVSNHTFLTLRLCLHSRSRPGISLFIKVEVKFTLRLAVYCQSVCLGVKPLETHDQRSFSPN
jgi:hypothetical protein